MTRTAMAALAILVLGATSGCTTVRESFAGRDPEQVWTALVAVARTPDYSDTDPDKRWLVKENHVLVDDANGRLEIYRELDRILQRERTKPLREHRNWRFQIVFEQTEPPTATFVSRGWGVPMQAKTEGERYFADVWDLLGGAGEPEMTTQPETQPAAAPETQPEPGEKPIVNIEDLEPDGG